MNTEDRSDLKFINAVDAVIAELTVLDHASWNIRQESVTPATCDLMASLLNMISDQIDTLTKAQRVRIGSDPRLHNFTRSNAA